MNDRKHVVVGLFVLGGMVLLAVLIIWFGSVAGLIRGGYRVRASLPNAKGIQVGKRVHLDGIEIGDVQKVTSRQPEATGVWVHMRVNPDVRIPETARFVAQQTMTGDVYLNFESTGKTSGSRPTDGSARVEGKIRPPSLLPPDIMEEFRRAMGQFKRLDTILANVQELTEPRTPEDVESGKRRNLWTTLAQFQETARTIDRQLKGEDDEHGFGRLLAQANARAAQLEKTLNAARETFENTNETLKTFNRTGKTLDEAGKQVGRIGKKAELLLKKGDALLAKLSKTADDADALLANLNAAVTEVRDGKGTVGKLMTDDELHRALVTLVENLTAMTENADRLITLWRKESIFAKEGG